MYNKLPANKMNKQTDTEKERDKVTDNKDDRRIHRKVCICEKKKYNKLLTHVGYQIKTASKHGLNLHDLKEKDKKINIHACLKIMMHFNGHKMAFSVAINGNHIIEELC